MLGLSKGRKEDNRLQGNQSTFPIFIRKIQNNDVCDEEKKPLAWVHEQLKHYQKQLQYHLPSEQSPSC